MKGDATTMQLTAELKLFPTGLPEMDCPLITSEHSSRISQEEFHD